MKKIIGKCSICNGDVMKDEVWLGVVEQHGECSKCGATENKSTNLPVIPMEKCKTVGDALRDMKITN